MNTIFLAMLASLSTLGSCTDVEDRLGPADFPTKGADGVAYYLDSKSGDDSNDGLSAETAWRSLERVEKVYLQAGNSILLRRGSSWQGQLAPRGQGTQSQPIVVGAYGEGALPLIEGCGKVDAAVKLTNQSYWVIENLEVTNAAPARDAYRCGIMVENNGGATVSGITIRNNKVHDVTGSFSYSGDYHPHQFGGISCTTMSVTAGEEKFDNVLIEGNEVERVGRTGIVVWDFVWGSNTQSSTNVVIRGNTVRETDSDGILTYGCNGSLIEYNLADGCGSWREDGGFNGAAAIWCTRGKNCVIQFNEACNTRALEGNDDGTGFDIDLDSTDCIVQYNYSHDNAGGFMLIIDAHKEQGSGSKGSIVRYNISQNDRKRLFMVAGGVTPGMQIYNNTLYVGEGLDTKLMDHTWDNAGDLDAAWSFRNNLICNFGSGEWVVPGSQGQFAGNIYWGNHPASEPDEADKMTFDPMLAAPGTGGSGLASLDGYKLQEASPAVNAGVQVASNGGRDFWGNPVSRRGQATVGACEPNGEVQLGGYLWDPIDDWSQVYFHSDNLNLDSSNPHFFDTDASRAVRQDKNDGVLVYRLDNLKSAMVTAYFGVWYGVTSIDVIRMEVSATGREDDYAPVAVRGGSAGDVAEGWQKYEIHINETLPDGMNFLKVSMVDTFNEAWAIQLGEVEISDEPAEVILPSDNTFTEPFDNLGNLAFSSGDNLIVAWSSEEDIAAFFDGDAGRVARSNGNEAVMAWQYAGVADFALTAYLCGDPGDDFGFLQVLGTAAADPSTLTAIPVEFTLAATRGDWREYRITPSGDMPQGYNFLAIRLPQTAHAPGGWELQLGELKISDRKLSEEPVTPVDPAAFNDPLDNLDKLTFSSGDNLIIAWSSEEDIAAYFDGDAGRLARSNGNEAVVAWQYAGVADFAVTAFFCGDPGQDEFLQVLGTAAADPSTLTAIPVRFSLVATRGDWREYRITPSGDVPQGYNFLAIRLPQSPLAPQGWELQIADVQIADRKFSQTPDTPGPTQTITDELGDMSRLFAKSDNVVTDWGNEANFKGDGARATRNSSAAGFIAYACPGLSDFDITAFFSVYIDNSYLKVYAASSDDFSDWVEIPCTFTEISAVPDAFTGYSVTPAGAIPENCGYLYIEMLQIPVEGNGWTTQIGTVKITCAAE